MSQTRVCPKVNELLRLLQPWNCQVKQMFTVRSMNHKQSNCGMPKSNSNLWRMTCHLVMTRQVMCVSCEMEMPLQLHRAPQLLQLCHESLDKAVWPGYSSVSSSSLPLWCENENKVHQPSSARQYVKRVKHSVWTYLVLCKTTPTKWAQLYPSLWL